MASNAVGPAGRAAGSPRRAGTNRSARDPRGVPARGAQAQQRSSAAAYAKQARFHFRLDPEASLDEIAAVAGYYPVFRVASRR